MGDKGQSLGFRAQVLSNFERVMSQRVWLFCAMLICVLALLWPSQSLARSVDSVSLTPALSVQGVGAANEGAPGEVAPAAFTVTNQGATLALTGEFDFTAPLLNTSVIRGWWMVVERRTGSGAWTPVAGSSAAAAGHNFSVAPPATTGMSIQASPKPVLGVSYPATGDRVVGTQIPGLFRANWDYDAELTLGATATSSLMSAATSGDVRLRWRLESRNTGLFGIVTSGSSSNTAPFTQMLGSQSSSASNVTVTVTGDGRTQSFTAANTAGLNMLPVGASASIAATAKIPSIAARAGGESVADYLERLETATNQAVSLNAVTSFTASGSALAYWWWPWDTDSPFDTSAARTVTAPGASNSADPLVPIVQLSKTGPASVNAGSPADYEITASNAGDAAGVVSVIDTVDGYLPQVVPGFGSIAAGSGAMQPFTHPVSITTPSGTLLNTASATWTDSAGNAYGPIEDFVTSAVIGDEDPPPPPTLTLTPPAFTNATTSTFEFTGEPGGGFECSVDASALSACSAPFTTGVLADGQHQFSVSQRDAAGNLGSSVSYLWTVDTVSPSPVVITDAPAGLVASSDAIVEFTSESEATVECQINGGAWSACASPASFVALPDGETQLLIRQIDLAENTSTPAAASWTVDTTAPAAPEITTAPPTESTSSEATFEFVVEADSSAQCSIDGVEFSSCTSPLSFSSLEEGVHTFAVRAEDAAGNIGGAVAFTWIISFEVNQCRPEVTESAPLEIPDEAGMEDDGGTE